MKEYIHYGTHKFNIQHATGECIVINDGLNKPSGNTTWASPVNCTFSWKEWCEREDFRECIDENSFTFTLYSSANILYIDKNNIESVYNEYGIDTDDYHFTRNLDWEAISKIFDGAEIDLWSDDNGIKYGNTDMNLSYRLFSSWDCDSIVIWNTNIIKVKEIKSDIVDHIDNIIPTYDNVIICPECMDKLYSNSRFFSECPDCSTIRFKVDDYIVDQLIDLWDIGIPTSRSKVGGNGEQNPYIEMAYSFNINILLDILVSDDNNYVTIEWISDDHCDIYINVSGFKQMMFIWHAESMIMEVIDNEMDINTTMAHMNYMVDIIDRYVKWVDYLERREDMMMNIL